MDFFTAMEVSASGLSAERTRMNVASSNLANVNTTQTEAGGAYKRRTVTVGSVAAPGTIGGTAPGAFDSAIKAVEVTGIEEDEGPPRLEYDPGHPDADINGYVEYPNINVIEEMVDMITASRAYEAGITALDTAVAMAERAVDIGG